LFENSTEENISTEEKGTNGRKFNEKVTNVCFSADGPVVRVIKWRRLERAGPLSHVYKILKAHKGNRAPVRPTRRS
jgi:hypothetical protein